MYRVLPLFLLFVLLPPAVFATPFPINIFENFQDGDVDYPYFCPSLVEEQPSDPSQSYALIEAPALNGSFGLTLVRGEGGNDPWIAIWDVYCCSWGSGTIEVELAAPPGREFGVCRLQVQMTDKDDVITEYTEPGEYVFDIPDYSYVGWIFWIGHDVILDHLRYETICGCYMANEVMTWGALKASYR